MLQFRSVGTIGLIVALIAGICFCPSALAQDDQYQPLGPDDLQQLVAPIALYPDAILAQVLVAATYPDDVTAADQWLAGGNNPAGIDDQGWDLSVKGVARFPDVLHYMAGNYDWMDDLGDAFLNQQNDVMDAVQALRSQALAAGSLVSNDQQQVVVMGSTIEIIPADPNTIYLPIYDPQTVYDEADYAPGTVIVDRIRYGPAVRCGPWLHHDCDWDDRAVYVGDWGVDRPWWKHDPHGGRLDYTHDRPGIFHGSDHVTINVHNKATNFPAGRWNRADHDPHKAMPKVIPHPGGHLPDVKSGKKYPPRVDFHGGKPNAAGKQDNGPLNYGSGPGAAKASQRGKDSRGVQNNHPEAKPIETKTPEPKPEEKKPEEKRPVVAAKPTEQKPPAQKPPEQKPTEPARHALPKEESHPAPTPAPKESPKPEPKPEPKPAPKPPPAPPPQQHSESKGGGGGGGGGAISGYDRGQQAGADSQRGAQSRGSGGGGGSSGGGGGAKSPPPPAQKRGK